jgi:alkylated DNA nucleotide flippase Atl1
MFKKKLTPAMKQAIIEYHAVVRPTPSLQQIATMFQLSKTAIHRVLSEHKATQKAKSTWSEERREALVEELKLIHKHLNALDATLLQTIQDLTA